jgi:hypothetical protein
MAATTTLTAPTTHVPVGPTTHRAARRSAPAKQLWKTGAIAGFAASVATVAIAGTAQALDVPIEVGGAKIPLAGFAQMTLVGAVIGIVLATVLARRARRPHHTFVVTTIALTVLSIIPDALADAQTATRFTLALTHVVAAAIVIPALASRLSD